MPVKVYRSTGTDGTETINGQPGGKVYVSTDCQADYDDIRFTKSDGTTLLDCWLESYDANSGIFNVEFDSIPAHPDDGSFYIYYGNASATAVSNGANTFTFWDGFDSDLSNWTGDTGSGSTASSVLTFSGDGNLKLIYSDTNTGTTYGIRARVNLDADLCYFGSLSVGVAEALLLRIGGATSIYSTDGTESYVATNATIDAYHIFDIIVRGGTNVRVFEDGSERTNSPKTTNPPNTSIPLVIAASTADAIKLDWIFIRTYTPNEPTFGTWGSHESIMDVGGGAITSAGSLSETATALQNVGQGAVTIAGNAIDTARTILQNVGDGAVAIAGSITEKLTALANVGQGAITIAGSLGGHIIRRLYATAGSAYRTFLKVTEPYRKFNKSGDYRNFKE
jgi:hypothetical protein